jgi:hypothetical protein
MVSIPIVTLSHISQLTHATKQQNLIMVLNIHEPGDTTDRFFGQISQQVTKMVYPKVPFWITGFYSREQANGIPGNFHWMLIAEDIDSLQSSSLDGIILRMNILLPILRKTTNLSTHCVG